jgi:RNA polymerase sporulation-specific sigma factor
MSEESYYRRVKQHHRGKYMLGNLSNEDKQFLIDKGISIEEYNRMSPFEREVFELKINGFTYIEISEKLHKDKKAIDNAIQRIKTKIKDNLDY